MMRFDYIILGAGSAGCVLANRLSANPANEVLLVEAGGAARNPYLHVPKISGRLLASERYAWHYRTQPFGPNGTTEIWPRGKVIGGSSAINGLVYNRGGRADYDDLERLGNTGWGWDDMLPVFKSIEDNQFGASPTRGNGGELSVTTASDPDMLCSELIIAGTRLGLRPMQDINESDEERIGFSMATIRDGRRVSAATAFLNPIRRRPNLHVLSRTVALRLVLEHGRATGVVLRSGASDHEVRARREVIVSLGALASPKLLQLSGIGPREVLTGAGVPIYLERDNVGRRMREHRCMVNTYRLKDDLGHNRSLSTLTAKARTAMKYLANGDGPLARPGGGEVLAIFKTQPHLDRVDGQMLVAPITLKAVKRGGSAVERLPGICAMGEVLRATSEGRVWIISPDPDAPLVVDPGFLTSEYDRRTGADVLRTMRRLFLQSPIAERIGHEMLPGLDAQTDDELIDAALDNASTGYHATGFHAMGTCAMGPDDDDIVDDRLRVRGIDGLRVMDCSIMPTMVSGNPNGPTMAMAARAAELILDDARPVHRRIARHHNFTSVKSA